MGLLYQDIVKSEQLKKGVLLPPILPLVLYNGSKEWVSPLELNSLFESVPEPFRQYQPQVKYLLIDEGRYADELLEPLENIVAVLFRLENSVSSQQFENALDSLIKWLQKPDQVNLQRIFTLWIKRVLLPRKLVGQKVPDLTQLHEIKTMLAERNDQWTKTWEQHGIEKGIEKGIEQGIEQGIEKGRQQGEATILLRQLTKKFGFLSPETTLKIKQADSQTLLNWSENILSAETIEDVLQ